MKRVMGHRAAVALFVAVLMPLEVGHCALMPLQASAVAVESAHHDDGDHDCCPEATPSHQPTSTTDPCCCGNIHLPAATAPVAVSIDAPTLAPSLFAVAAIAAAADHVQSMFALLEPDARSGSPPDPSSAPQSPRSPPHAA